MQEEDGGEEKGRKKGRKKERGEEEGRMREEDGEGKDEWNSLCPPSDIGIRSSNEETRRKKPPKKRKNKKPKTHKNPLINLLSTPKIRPLRRIKRKQRFFFIKNLQFRSTRRRIPEEIVFCDEGFYGNEMLVTLNVIGREEEHKHTAELVDVIIRCFFWKGSSWVS